MKKIFTLAAMAMMALAANAQVEVAFANTDIITDKDAGTALAAGTVVASTSSITWKTAGDQTFKEVALCGDADVANTVVIGGASYKMEPGVQAQGGNGKSLGTDGKSHPGIQGSEQKIEATATGMLYVFHKGTATKNYYVYEGDLASNTGAPVAYSMAIQPTTEGSTKYVYDVAEDAQGLNYADMNDINYWASVGTINTPANMPGSTWATGNALCVFVFPVYADAKDYYLWAQGSKITMGGFVFVPAADPAHADQVAAAAGITFDKATAVNNVKAAAEAAEAPAKVIVNGQVVIADKFNAAGAQVK